MMDFGILGIHKHPTSLLMKNVQRLEELLEDNCHIPIDAPENVEDFEGDFTYKLSWTKDTRPISLCRSIECYKVAIEFEILNEIIKKKCGLAITIANFRKINSNEETLLALEILATLKAVESKCVSANEFSSGLKNKTRSIVFELKQIENDIRLLKENIERKCDAAINAPAAIYSANSSNASSTPIPIILSQKSENDSNYLEFAEGKLWNSQVQVEERKKSSVCKETSDSSEESHTHKQTLLFVSDELMQRLWMLTELGFNLGGLIGAFTVPTWANKVGRYQFLGFLIMI